MKKQVRFALSLAVLALPCSLQAALVNTTTNQVLWNDTFETIAVGSTPTTSSPQVGTYSMITAGSNNTIQIKDATSGVAAKYGDNYVAVVRPANGASMGGTNPPIGLTASALPSNAGDTLKLEIAIWVDSATGAVGTMAMSGSSAPTTPMLLLNFYAANVFGKTAQTIAYINDAGTAVNLTQKFNVGAWNTLVLTHTNGERAWSLSVNGATAETFEHTSAAKWDQVNFRAGNTNTTFRVDSDALPEPIPEPATALIAGMGTAGVWLLGKQRSIAKGSGN